MWLREYADVMKDVAKGRAHRFVDLYDLTKPRTNSPPLTDNGIHLNGRGYWAAARAIETQLGLPPSDKLSINGRGAVVIATHDGPSDQFELLRHFAIKKNVQYFNQWRPANETYIFGFRAHEQGKNAAEMPKFAEPIAKLEDEITRLAKPAEAVCEPKPQ
jgi:hypothetical protein